MDHHWLTSLQISYINHSRYPRNLAPTENNAMTSFELEALWERLQTMCSLLCLPDGDVSVMVPIRDFYSSSEPGCEKKNMRSSDDFDEWIGIQASEKTAQALSPCLPFSRARPMCRFIYIYGLNSRARLNIDRSLLTKIMSFHQVMPEIVDFLAVFGLRFEPSDLHFSAFQSKVCKAPPLPSSRSVKATSFQLCYNLKGVTCKAKRPRVADHDWSIRQAVVHHQFDCLSGRTLWLIFKGGLDLQLRFKELTGPEGQKENRCFDDVHLCFRSSLGVHMMLCRWSRENWNQYISWLECVVDSESTIALHGTRVPGLTRRHFKTEDLQQFQQLADSICQAMTVLKANVEVLSSLASFYQDLWNDIESTFRDDEAHIDWFIREVKSMVNLFNMQITRTSNLKETINSRKELIMHHMQNQALDRADQLNIHLERDAILMRIITLVTLCYLPSMFVSSFFGTDIIKFQDSNGGEPNAGKYSSAAMERWFQLTLPLTVVTLVLSLLAYRMAGSASERRRLTLNGCDVEPSAKRRFNVGSLRQLFGRKRPDSTTDPKTVDKDIC